MDSRWLMAFFTAVTPASILAGRTTGARLRAKCFGSILFKGNVVTTGGGVQRILMAVAVLCALTGGARAADSAVTPGAIVIERPTLLSLGFEWKISGDDNRNAVVAVTFRKAGESKWRNALPLFRMSGEFIAGPKPQFGGLNYYNYTVPPAFAGSVLNLQPDTEYEMHFAMRDPDGVNCEAEKTVTVRTRKTPAAAAGGHVYHVYPFSHKAALGPNEF